jgi:hypothetical protein
MSVEQWKSLFDIGTVVCAGLVFLLGAGVLITGNIINKRQAEEIKQFGVDLKDKDVKIAEANDRAGAAIERASKADERASKNEQEAARLTKEAEDERMARIQLAASISWRAPDRALIAELASPLQRFEGQRYVFVVDPSEPERSGVLSWIVILLGTASGLRQTECTLTRAFRARFTFSRISEADAVQMKGFGCSL